MTADVEEPTYWDRIDAARERRTEQAFLVCHFLNQGLDPAEHLAKFNEAAAQVRALLAEVKW